ncbi:MAG TPA: DUF1207 domain-containing protein [Gemmatimonadaceae bacterium]|jgi:hypothetical protein|nr:DUF1207 domain-containing protein [Gemmatimonadaceae bacterium]
MRNHVALVVALALSTGLGAQRPSGPERCGTGIPASEVRAYVGLPSGNVFCPLVADPKAMRSFLSYLVEDKSVDSIDNVGSVGISDSFGLARWGATARDDGVQLSLEGAIFAQFDLGSSSYDLINADYLVAVPLTMRRGHVSARLRAYHQSSHLGDELLINRGESLERENISFEAADFILSIDAAALRLYGGGEYIFNRAPKDLEHYIAHGGAELRPATELLRWGRIGFLRFIAAVDLKASQQQDYDPSVSVRAGFEINRPFSGELPARSWSILFESYRGPSPYGQFFRQKIQLIGVGAHFAL